MIKFVVKEKRDELEKANLIVDRYQRAKGRRNDIDAQGAREGDSSGIKDRFMNQHFIVTHSFNEYRPTFDENPAAYTILLLSTQEKLSGSRSQRAKN